MIARVIVAADCDPMKLVVSYAAQTHLHRLSAVFG